MITRDDMGHLCDNLCNTMCYKPFFNLDTKVLTIRKIGQEISYFNGLVFFLFMIKERKMEDTEGLNTEISF